jgi:hypothetical protein
MAERAFATRISSSSSGGNLRFTIRCSSVTMDGSGNIALAYNVSNTTMFPSLRYTGRLASDPLGTMPRGEQTLIDCASANSLLNNVIFGGR